MRLLSSRRLIWTAAALVLVSMLYLASWRGDWRVVAGRDRTASLELPIDRFGLTPAMYWHAASRRLLLVPQSLVPLGERPTSAVTGHDEVLEVDVDSGEASWQPLSRLSVEGAVDVKWQIEGRLRQDGKTEQTLAYPEDGGPSVELGFHGVRFPMLAYGWNFPPFGEPGWHLETRYVGKVSLSLHDTSGGPAAVELTQWLVNSPMFPELISLARWLPQERFLVIDPRSYGERRLLLVGPPRGALRTHEAPG